MSGSTIGFIWALLLVAGVQGSPAALIINVGTHTVPAGTNIFQVPIQITGGDLVTDMAGAIQIGEGGPLVGGKSGPRIVSLSYAGSIWTNAPGGFVSNATVLLPAEVYDPNISLSASGQKVSANGLLCRLTIDATGFSPGVYDLKLAGVGPAASTFSTQFQNSGTNVPVTIYNGRIGLGTIPPPLRPSLLIAQGTNRQALVSFFGELGQRYRIQWATNPGSFLGEVPVDLVGPGGLITWVDDGSYTGQLPGLAARRFYRVRLVTASSFPTLRIVAETNRTARLTFNTESGRTYWVQWTGNLATNWNEITSSLPGTGGNVTWVDDGTLTGQLPGLAGRRFYRVRTSN